VYFRNQKEALLNKALEGVSSVVKWEEISILEVLSKREQSILARGNSSYIVKQSLEQIIHLSDDPEVKKIDKYLEILPRGHEYEKEIIPPQMGENHNRFSSVIYWLRYC